MENKFEKMDDWMMKAARSVREEKIPQKELDAFHEGVMKKIATRQQLAPGMPFFAMALTGALSLAIILGAVFYLNRSPVSKTEPPTPVMEVSPRVSAPLPQEVPEKVSVSVEKITRGASTPQAAIFKEEEIIEEIEALKELGAWTDEDEAEAGIPLEVTYADLEIGMESNTQTTPPSVVLNS